MPTLKDYLGSLVKDLNHARVIADIESANIAQMYAENEILKHFSIPRMKIQDTELTIPIAIDNLEAVQEEHYQPIDNNKFYSQAYQTIKNTLETRSIKSTVSRDLSNKIKKKINQLETAIKGGQDIELSLDEFCDEISEKSITTIKKNNIEETKFTNLLNKNKLTENLFKEKLSERLKNNLKNKIKPKIASGKIENSMVTVESDKLKEKKPESLLYIKMKITEESMEWQTLEDPNGNIVSKLMAE